LGMHASGCCEEDELCEAIHNVSKLSCLL
jgi:hypothetical protein